MMKFSERQTQYGDNFDTIKFYVIDNSTEEEKIIYMSIVWFSYYGENIYAFIVTDNDDIFKTEDINLEKDKVYAYSDKMRMTARNIYNQMRYKKKSFMISLPKDKNVFGVGIFRSENTISLYFNKEPLVEKVYTVKEAVLTKTDVYIDDLNHLCKTYFNKKRKEKQNAIEVNI